MIYAHFNSFTKSAHCDYYRLTKRRAGLYAHMQFFENLKNLVWYKILFDYALWIIYK